MQVNVGLVSQVATLRLQVARLSEDLDNSLRREDIECFKNAVSTTLDEEQKTVIYMNTGLYERCFIVLLYMNTAYSNTALYEY